MKLFLRKKKKLLFLSSILLICCIMTLSCKSTIKVNINENIDVSKFEKIYYTVKANDNDEQAEFGTKYFLDSCFSKTGAHRNVPPKLFGYTDSSELSYESYLNGRYKLIPNFHNSCLLVVTFDKGLCFPQKGHGLGFNMTWRKNINIKVIDGGSNKEVAIINFSGSFFDYTKHTEFLMFNAFKKALNEKRPDVTYRAEECNLQELKNQPVK